MMTAVIVQPLVALVAGILITPRLLNYIVAIYLIIIGLAGLLPHLANPPAAAAGSLPHCAPVYDRTTAATRYPM